MDQITLKNYRCFREQQTARLAPLTLLVGENSTGKTSFLAMIRALWDVAFRHRVPDFKEDPYDLGSFDELAHHRGARGSRAHTFEAGLDHVFKRTRGLKRTIEFTFGRSGSTPVLVSRRLTEGDNWIEDKFRADRPYMIQLGTSRGSWEVPIQASLFDIPSSFGREMLWPFPYFLGLAISKEGQLGEIDIDKFTPLAGSPAFNKEDLTPIFEHAYSHMGINPNRPFASAPVRSKPHRTYDPSRPTSDPEGDYVPMYLANVYFQERSTWNALKDALESFGQAAGLFDEISIKPLGRRDSEPFQLQVRKFGGRLKGPWHNLIDVGYGVSQVLPVITELLRQDAPPMFLLQQPEVHLHPSAQAALGSLFCQVASWDRQLIIETHSDHLLDRVRMDVRDGATQLKPEDVSILYFERGELDVRIHSLRLDGEGNVLGAPEGYRRFFMEETARSLWKRRGL